MGRKFLTKKFRSISGTRLHSASRGVGRGGYSQFHPRSAKHPGLSQPQVAGIGVAEMRQNFGVTQDDLSRVTGYSIRSIAGWESGRPISNPARQKFMETKRLFAALAELMPAEAVAEWLREPNDAFDGQPPLHLIELGESDRLWQMIHQIDAGVAS